MSYRGQIVVSLVVLAMLAADGMIILLVPMPAGAEDCAKILIGGLITQCSTVVSWWLGSSRGSMQKDNTIHALSGAQQPGGG